MRIMNEVTAVGHSLDGMLSLTIGPGRGGFEPTQFRLQVGYDLTTASPPFSSSAQIPR